MARRNPSKRYLLCISSLGYEVSLDVWKVYRQLSDEWAESHEMVRVIDNTADDFLFPASHFVPIDIAPAVERKIKASAKKLANQPTQAAAT